LTPIGEIHLHRGDPKIETFEIKNSRQSSKNSRINHNAYDSNLFISDRPYDEELFVNSELVDSKSYELYKTKSSIDEYNLEFRSLSILLEMEQIVCWKI
jgi:hypothetical protein